MKNLTFNKGQADQYEAIISDASSTVTVHLNYNNGSRAVVYVDRSLDPVNLGWSQVDKREAKGIYGEASVYEETICGIPSGTKIRIRTDIMPVNAKYQLD